jgi:hypothetical protein
VGDETEYKHAGAWHGWVTLAGLVAFPTVGATTAAVNGGEPLQWLLAVALIAATAVVVGVTVRSYRRERAAMRTIAQELDQEPSATIEPGYEKDWLDRIAPIGKGAFRESGGGLILFGVVGLGGGLWMFLSMPFWQQTRHLPAGPLGILAAAAGVYFLLLAINVFRRTPK